MANVYAVKTGNWSDTTVWNTAALPTSADDVYANTFTVTINQDVTVKSLRTTSATGITAGGGFACSTARTIDLSAGSGVVPGSSNCLTLSHATGTTVTVNAAVLGSTTTANMTGMALTGTGTTNLTGNVTGGTVGGGTAAAITFSANATLTVTGVVQGSTGSVNNSAYGINLAGTSGVLTITGNVGPGTRNAAVYATGPATITIIGNITTSATENATQSVLVTGAAVISITGSVTGSTAGTFASVAIGNTSATVSIVGTLTASLGSAINGSATFTLSGPFVSSTSGIIPIGVTGIVKLTGAQNTEYRFAKSTGGTTSLWSSDVNSGAPSVANVRKGTTFGVSSEFTGTATVPAASDVLSGVPVDNTVGTARIVPDKWLRPL